MKILCVVPSYYPAFKFGGPIASVHFLNKTLVKKGVGVTVYTTNIGLETEVPVNKEVDVDGVKVIYFGFSQIVEFFGKIFRFFGPTGWQFSQSITSALKKNLNNFDIVYLSAIWNYPTAVTAHYCRKYKKPYVIAPRGIFYPYTFNKKVWKKWPYYQLITKRDLENASFIHYTTLDEFERGHSFLGIKNNRTIIVPNGIDLSEFNNLPPKENFRNKYPILKDKKVILFLSRLDWKKGLDVLAKAYGLLSKKRNDVYLVIVGDGPENFKNQVKIWFKNEGVFEKTLFTGMFTGREKLEAYTGSDIFVLPSHSESFGMVVIEAMACGVPTIVSDGVGLYQEIKDSQSGIIFPCGDATKLAESMNNFLNDAALLQSTKENAQKLIKEKFDIDKVADETLKEFKKLLNS
jgi:glycosyltransferase involved in cell wall biosynthesis